jgi:hypothetical protein
MGINVEGSFLRTAAVVLELKQLFREFPVAALP